ncbi:MAG: (Fe-S)-binding protein [Calditrichaeota bacterium]|nr:MAG: (Fe-S)-binding protein [Calditrichota bacterium]
MDKINLFPKIPDDFLLQCMHCGMCLPSCPTYVLTKRERSSPRGRIRLIKSVSEGKLPISDAFIAETTFCLDCRACETACPAGVQYGRIIEETRWAIAQQKTPDFKSGLIKKLLLNGLFAKQKRLQFVARLIRIYQCSGIEWLNLKLNIAGLFSKKLKDISPLAPKINKKFTHQLLPEFLPAKGETKFKVGLLTGCMQDIAFSDVNVATAEVLALNNCDVFIPRNQGCCGSVHAHSGDSKQACQQILQNAATFDLDSLDAIIVNAAGCGAFLKESDKIFSGDSDSATIDKVASKTKDISEFLCEIGFKKPEENLKLDVTYHDACHLAHGQKIRSAPREIIESIPGIKLIEMEESDWCCGSAGVYNITHTETAFELLDRKMGNIAKTGASIIVSANPGCSIQLAYGVSKQKNDMQILHPVSLLWRAYQGESGN